eukprot:g11473.t1
MHTGLSPGERLAVLRKGSGRCHQPDNTRRRRQTATTSARAGQGLASMQLSGIIVFLVNHAKQTAAEKGEFFLSRKAENQIDWFNTVYTELTTPGGADTQEDLLQAFPPDARLASADPIKQLVVKFVEAARFIESQAPAEWFKNLLRVDKLNLHRIQVFVREVQRLRKEHTRVGGKGRVRSEKKEPSGASIVDTVASSQCFQGFPVATTYTLRWPKDSRNKVKLSQQVSQWYNHDIDAAGNNSLVEHEGVVISRYAYLKRDGLTIHLAVRSKQSLQKGQIFCSEFFTPDMLNSILHNSLCCSTQHNRAGRYMRHPCALELLPKQWGMTGETFSMRIGAFICPQQYGRYVTGCGRDNEANVQFVFTVDDQEANFGDWFSTHLHNYVERCADQVAFGEANEFAREQCTGKKPGNLQAMLSAPSRLGIAVKATKGIEAHEHIICFQPTSFYCGRDAPASDVPAISLRALDTKASLPSLCHCWGAGVGEETSTTDEEQKQAREEELTSLEEHLLAALKYREQDLQWRQGKIKDGKLASAQIPRMQSRFHLNVPAVLPGPKKWHTTFPLLQSSGVATDLFGKNLYEAKSSGVALDLFGVNLRQARESAGVARDKFGIFLHENKSSGLARDLFGRGVYEEQRSGVALDLFGVNVRQARESAGVARDKFGVFLGVYEEQRSGVALDLFGVNVRQARESAGVTRDKFGVFLYENKSSGLARDLFGRGVYEEQRSGVALDLFGMNVRQARESAGVARDKFGVFLHKNKSSGLAREFFGRGVYEEQRSGVAPDLSGVNLRQAREGLEQDSLNKSSGLEQDSVDSDVQEDLEQRSGMALDLFGVNLRQASESAGVARDIFGMFFYEHKSSGLARDCFGRGLYEEQRSGVALDLFGVYLQDCFGRGLYEEQRSGVALDLFGVYLQQARESTGVALDVFGVSIYDFKSSGVALDLWSVYLSEAKEAFKAVERAEQVRHRAEAKETLAFLQKEALKFTQEDCEVVLKKDQINSLVRAFTDLTDLLATSGKRRLGDQCPLPLSCGVETSRTLYLARSPVHGWGGFAADKLHQGECYAAEVVDNKRVREVYHYLDCLTLLPERTQYRWKCQAMVVLVDQASDKETLQRGLVVVPRSYVSYLNHTDKNKANAKIEIRINRTGMDFLLWARSVSPVPGLGKAQLGFSAVEQEACWFFWAVRSAGFVRRFETSHRTSYNTTPGHRQRQSPPKRQVSGTSTDLVIPGREAVGLLSEAPDGVQLFGKNYACKFCCVKPDGWPGPGHKNLNTGSCKGCLGHTVFAVALNEQLDNVSAFTTEDIPVGAAKRHRGIFFDGKLLKKPECKHKSYLILVGSRPVHRSDRLYVDGFDLISEYKQTQTNLLGVLWECPDKPQHGTWRKFLQLSGGKSIIFHLPKHLRYRGSAHLTNSSKGAIESVPNMTGKGLTPSELQPVESFDVAAEAFLCPYLQRSTGEGVAKMGMQLTWSYTPRYRANAAGEDRDRQTVTAPNRPSGECVIAGNAGKCIVMKKFWDICMASFIFFLTMVSSEIARMSAHRGGHPRVIQFSAAAGYNCLRQHKLEYFLFPGSLQQDQDQDTALVLSSIHGKEDEVLKQNIQAQLNALSESKATVTQKVLVYFLVLCMTSRGWSYIFQKLSSPSRSSSSSSSSLP